MENSQTPRERLLQSPDLPAVLRRLIEASDLNFERHQVDKLRDDLFQLFSEARRLAANDQLDVEDKLYLYRTMIALSPHVMDSIDG